MEVRMLTKDQPANALMSPVAILDKEILKDGSFRIETFELCSLCGARFGIGFLGGTKVDERFPDEMKELPPKLIALLAKDHHHHRQHKDLIELDY
jgi:hypothetical protein